MTSMGARQHLTALEADGWVGFSDEARGRGRPIRLWHLTEQAWQRFPDTHSELTLQLIDDVQQLFGERPGSTDRTAGAADAEPLSGQADPAGTGGSADRAQGAAQPGGLYGGHEPGGGWQLAMVGESLPHLRRGWACRGFCRSELALFRQLLAPAGWSGSSTCWRDRRCLCRIRPPQAGDAGAQKQQSRRRDACFVAFERMLSFQPVVSR